MTLVLALQGQHEVVMAADSMVHTSAPEGMYKSKMSKLTKVAQNWVIGIAGGPAGYYLQRCMEEANMSIDPKGHAGVNEYEEKMRDLYRRGGYRDDALFLLACVHEDGPAVYDWKLKTDIEGHLMSSGVQPSYGIAAIGAYRHGALYLAHAYHTSEMDTRQRVRLAYLCVHEAAKQDPRVGGPVEIAIVSARGVTFLSQDDLETLKGECREITAQLRKRLLEPGPPIKSVPTTT